MPDICKGFCNAPASDASTRGMCANCDDQFDGMEKLADELIAEEDKRNRHDTTSKYFFGTGTYFIKCGDFVKIGRTYNLPGRLSTIRTSNPLDIEVIKFTHFKDIERESHKKFKHLKHRDEWYKLTPELEAYIAAL